MTRASSKRGVTAIDHKTIRGVIRRRLAHQVNRDAAEIGRLAEPPHRNPGYHIGHEFFVGHHARGHVAFDPAGQDGIGRDALTRQFDREGADQRVDGGLGRGVMLVACGAENRREARGRDQPAERIARCGAFGHVARRSLKYMENAVEIGGEHAAPLFFGAVDEGVPSAAANAGVGEAAVDPAESLKRRGHRRFHRGGIGDVADASVGLAGAIGHGRGGVLVLLGIAAPDRDVASGSSQRLRDAKADAAIAAGDDGHAAGQIKDAVKCLHWAFPLVWCALFRASDGGQMFLLQPWTSPPRKSNMGQRSPTLTARGQTMRAHSSRGNPMQFKHVTLDIDGPVAILKLDHQEVMNAVSIDMLGGLGEALDAIEDKKAEVRCLVMTGAGRAFCTGANLQGRNNQKPGKSNAGAALETAFHPFLRRLRSLHCPIVTSVNGPAAGAGMSFALMGDMILCARSSYFLQAFRRIGLVPDCGSTWLLPRLIGKARSVELSLMGERLTAEKALEWGLVNRVYDDAALTEETMKLAHELANGPTIALSLIRKLYWDSPDNSFEDQLNLEFQSQRIAGAAEDFREGVTAFLEKRPAKFKGK